MAYAALADGLVHTTAGWLCTDGHARDLLSLLSTCQAWRAAIKRSPEMENSLWRLLVHARFPLVKHASELLGLRQDEPQPSYLQVYKSRAPPEREYVEPLAQCPGFEPSCSSRCLTTLRDYAFCVRFQACVDVDGEDDVEDDGVQATEYCVSHWIGTLDDGEWEESGVHMSNLVPSAFGADDLSMSSKLTVWVTNRSLQSLKIYEGDIEDEDSGRDSFFHWLNMPGTGANRFVASFAQIGDSWRPLRTLRSRQEFPIARMAPMLHWDDHTISLDFERCIVDSREAEEFPQYERGMTAGEVLSYLEHCMPWHQG